MNEKFWRLIDIKALISAVVKLFNMGFLRGKR